MTSLTTKEYPSVTFTAAEYQALLRCDLTAFAHRAFLDLHPDQELRRRYIELALAELELCRTGKTDRVIVTQRPRTLKSRFWSQSSFRRGSWGTTRRGADLDHLRRTARRQARPVLS